jgi:guanine deaminase
MMQEARAAAGTQRTAPEPLELTAAEMLYLSTLAGAEALDVAGETGNFVTGRSADFVYLRAPGDGPLADALARASSIEDTLAIWFTRGEADCIREVRVAGDIVFASP